MGNWRGNPIEQSIYIVLTGSCKGCGKEFSREVNTKNAPCTVYCSRHCYNVNRRLNKHGLTFEDLSQMLKIQNNSCAICKMSFDEIEPRKIHVDHCHKTGRVRGILCLNCNQGLGQFRDNPIYLRKAAEYLEID